MRARGWCSVAALLAACSFETADPVRGDGVPADGSTGNDVGDATGPSGPGTSTTSSPTPDPGTSEDPSDADPTADPGSTTDAPPDDATGGVDIDIGCPEPLPEGWVLCEDFESIPDPSSHFSEWQGAGVDLEGPGRQSPTALSITHQAGQNWSGVARIRFGEGPDAVNVAAPRGRFDELWVRFHSRVEEAWPTGGPGDILTLDGMSATPAYATAFLARVTADQSEPFMRSSAFTCVFGSDLACTGSNDWDLLSFRGVGIGEAPLFSDQTAGEWSCVVLHARLNTPGQSDGLLEVLVEDTLDSRVDNVDFRSDRGDFRFNQVSLPTFMQTPEGIDMHRYIDDVVVSTASLDCEG